MRSLIFIAALCVTCTASGQYYGYGYRGHTFIFQQPRQVDYWQQARAAYFDYNYGYGRYQRLDPRYTRPDLYYGPYNPYYSRPYTPRRSYSRPLIVDNPYIDPDYDNAIRNPYCN